MKTLGGVLLFFLALSGCFQLAEQPQASQRWDFEYLKYEMSEGAILEVQTSPMREVLDADLRLVQAIPVQYTFTSSAGTVSWEVDASSDFLQVRRADSRTYPDDSPSYVRVSWVERGKPLPYGIGAQIHPDAAAADGNLTSLTFRGNSFPVSFHSGRDAQLVDVRKAEGPRAHDFPLPALAAPEGKRDYLLFPGDHGDPAGFGYNAADALTWFFDQRPEEERRVQEDGCVAGMLMRRPTPARNATEVLPVLSSDPTSRVIVMTSDRLGAQHDFLFRWDHNPITREPRYGALEDRSQGGHTRSCPERTAKQDMAGALAIEKRLADLHDKPWTHYGVWTDLSNPRQQYQFTYHQDRTQCSTDCNGPLDHLDLAADSLFLTSIEMEGAKYGIFDVPR